LKPYLSWCFSKSVYFFSQLRSNFVLFRQIKTFYYWSNLLHFDKSDYKWWCGFKMWCL